MYRIQCNPDKLNQPAKERFGGMFLPFAQDCLMRVVIVRSFFTIVSIGSYFPFFFLFLVCFFCVCVCGFLCVCVFVFFFFLSRDTTVFLLATMIKLFYSQTWFSAGCPTKLWSPSSSHPWCTAPCKEKKVPLRYVAFNTRPAKKVSSFEFCITSQQAQLYTFCALATPQPAR